MAKANHSLSLRSNRTSKINAKNYPSLLIKLQTVLFVVLSLFLNPVTMAAPDGGGGVGVGVGGDGPVPVAVVPAPHGHGHVHFPNKVS